MIRNIFFLIYKKWHNRLIHKQFKGAHIGDINIGPELNKDFEIRHPENLYIGDKTAISGDLFINALGGVYIGKYCHIAKGLTIYSHNHNFRSEKAIPYDEVNIKKAVRIGDCVWIGCNVTIAPGTIIGDGVVISSGSVVFGEIPKCAIIRGNPAEIIGYRDKDTFEKLYKEEKFV